MKSRTSQNNLAPPDPGTPPPQWVVRGFTLVEVLISLGLIAVLLSLMLPALSGSKSRALATTSLGRIREMARGVQMYADDHKEYPPTFGLPGADERLPMRFDFGVAQAEWISHDTLYAFGVIPYLGTWRVAVPPGAPEPERFWVHGGVRVTTTDYHLTNTLYARPEMFDFDTMTGPEQFGAQRLSGVLFPSDKGLIFQNYIYHRPEFGTVLSCCTVDVPTPITFADHSASEHVMRRMLPGIFNPFMGYRAIFNIDIRTLNGTPVAQTRHGVRGRDRGPG